MTAARKSFRSAPEGRIEKLTAAAEGVSGPGTGKLPVPLVLLFRYQRTDAGDILSEGIMDDIVSALGNVREFRVISSRVAAGSHAGRCEGDPVPPLRADYLVGGSIPRLDDMMRIAVNLLDAQGLLPWKGWLRPRPDLQ